MGDGELIRGDRVSGWEDAAFQRWMVVATANNVSVFGTTKLYARKG